MAKIVNSDEFRQEMKEGVVVVDFFADWCGPCQMLGPVFAEVGSELEEKAKFLKVNVDNSADIAAEYQVASIPAILILKDGQKQDMMVGFSPKAILKDKIEQYL